MAQRYHQTTLSDRPAAPESEDSYAESRARAPYYRQVMTDITPFQHPFRFGYLSLCHAQLITLPGRYTSLISTTVQFQTPQDQLHKHAQTENKP